MSGQKKLKETIGLDLLGAERPPVKLLEELALHTKSAQLALFGTAADLDAFANLKLDLDIEYVPVEDVIGLDEDPLLSVRKKKNASVNIGMRLLKEGQISAYLGVGNTGAMMAAAKIHLPPLPHKPRPALLALLPTRKDPVAVLDVGANASVKPEHIVQFAKMGIAYQQTRGIKHPKVGLLNIGSEEMKGRKEVRESFKKLKKYLPKHFVGNVEAHDVFKGVVDVLVTDGFSGNVFLKTAEGMSQYILGRIESFLPDNESITSHLDTDTYPGALLCGVDHIVMKCHSYTSGEPIALALKATQDLIQNDLIKHLNQKEF